MFHFAAAFYLATELLYFWVGAHFQKYFIRIRDGQALFNQAMLNQDPMIRRYRQRRWMRRRSALALFRVFHCTMLTRFLSPVSPGIPAFEVLYYHVQSHSCFLNCGQCAVATLGKPSASTPNAWSNRAR